MNTVVIHSGGLDSTVLLYDLHAHGDTIQALSLHYGQRHAKEVTCAQTLCADLGVPWRLVDLSTLRPLLAGSSQTSEEIAVPVGHYTDETMKLTVVPNRNMILIAVAVAYAISLRYEAVAYAAHAGDHTIYPDCRPAFVTALRHAITLCDWSPVALVAPYLSLSKADLVKRGAAVGVPFAQTWSCYEGAALHCGRCGTCTERREAFALAGVTDPTMYAEYSTALHAATALRSWA